MNKSTVELAGLNVEDLIPAVKHPGGGEIIWGCFAGTAPTPLAESAKLCWIWVKQLENDLKQQIYIRKTEKIIE